MTNTSTENVAARSGRYEIGGDLPVVRLGYGTMQLTGEGVWGPPKDHDEAIRVLRRSVELGVTFFDTADSYGPTIAEELLAEALHPYADDVVIATKAGLTRTGPGEWVPVGRPAYLRQQAELSLRRLGLDRIDLFVELQAVELASLAARGEAESSATVRGRVLAARRQQEERGAAVGAGVCNAEIEVDQLERMVPLAPAVLGYLARAAAACGISARAWFRVIRVSRTIADLEGSDAVSERHVAEALSFRRALAETASGRPLASQVMARG